MKSPRFWYKDRSWQGVALSPLGWFYSWLTKQRLRLGNPYRASVPVICIGNINVGGTGKTPTTIALAERLKSLGFEPHIVSRGHGGSIVGPTSVSLEQHNADQVGDEPLLLAAFAPTWISKDRKAGVIAAERAGANVILLDDGFQNPAVSKDLSIVVIDATVGFGNGKAMPAGPLRENVSDGLARAQVVLTIGNNHDQTSFKHALPNHVKRIQAELVPLPTGMSWSQMRVLAFAGIGNPTKFFSTVKKLGANIVRSVALDDHQPLSEPLMQRLETDAKKHVAQLVTTEKDAVRLPPTFRSKVLTIPVRLEFSSATALDEVLSNIGLKRKHDTKADS